MKGFSILFMVEVCETTKSQTDRIIVGGLVRLSTEKSFLSHVLKDVKGTSFVYEGNGSTWFWKKYGASVIQTKQTLIRRDLVSR